MIITTPLSELQLDARRLHQALANTASGTPAFEQVGQLLGQKVTALQQAQLAIFTSPPLR